MVFLLLMGLCVFSVYQSEQERSRKVAIGFHRKLIVDLAVAVYKRVPMVYESEIALSQSAFHPFVEAPERQVLEPILIRMQSDHGRAKWYIGFQQGKQVEWRAFRPTILKDELTAEDASKRTRKLLRAYLWGTQRWVDTVSAVRQAVSTSARYAFGFRRKAGFPPLGEKPLPSPPAYDLPHTEAELRDYERWLCEALGVAVLTDGWGYPVRLELRQGQIVALSVGADGRAGTQDDIRVSLPLSDKD